MDYDTPNEEQGYADFTATPQPPAPPARQFKGRLEILGIPDSRVEVVDVPEWGTSIRLRSLSALEREQYEQSIVSIDKKGTMRPNMRYARARLVVMCAVDETGAPLFTTDDIPVLSMKSALVLDRLSDVASALSGMRDEDLEELLGNSASAPSGASPSR